MSDRDTHVNILGTEYRVLYRNRSPDSLISGIGGYTDQTSKKLVIALPESDNELEDSESYMKKNLRHEIIHAFLFESGLAHNSMKSRNWAVNEEMVDFFAVQSPKILKAFEEVGAL